jgi:hypothetical protein
VFLGHCYINVVDLLITTEVVNDWFELGCSRVNENNNEYVGGEVQIKVVGCKEVCLVLYRKLKIVFFRVAVLIII